jgi:hypothetical protein
MKKHCYFFILTLLYFTLSCDKEPKEKSIKVLNESELVDLVRFMFLEKHGGIQFERLHTTAELNKSKIECNQSATSKVDICEGQFKWFGDIQLIHYCLPHFQPPTQFFFNFENAGFAFSDFNWLIKGDNSGGTAYAFDTEKNKILYSQSSNRDLNLSNSTIGIDCLGNFKALSNISDYDPINKRFSKEVDYTINLSLSDKSKDLGGFVTLDGNITLNQDDQWLFTSILSGNTYKL